MQTLFDTAAAATFKNRLAELRADSPRQWGKMTPAQAVAHCAGSLELALGDVRPPRMLIGRLIGRLIKPLVLGNDAPMRRNSPTVPGFAVTDDRDFERERARLLATIDRFVTAGRDGCTSHPHSFFGPLTPDEWGVLMYKHLDHHLRQFAA